MQFSILALTLAATGALALPGREKPQKPEKPQPPAGNVQTINCSSGSPYCCTSEFDAKKGKNVFKCADFLNSCNAVAVCCNNNANNGAGASQTCSGIGDTNIIFI